MARKTRKDITVKGLERKLKLPPGSIRNADGSDARSDKKLETLQKEGARVRKVPGAKTAAVKKMLTPELKRSKTSIKPVTADQKTAAKRRVKPHPKAAALTQKLRSKLTPKHKQ